MNTPFEHERPGGPMNRLAAGEIARDTKEFLDAMDDYLDVAALNGPGRPSEALVQEKRALLMELARNAAYSGTQRLRIAHVRLMFAVHDFENSGKLLRNHRITRLYKRQDAYRELAGREIARLRGVASGV